MHIHPFCFTYSFTTNSRIFHINLEKCVLKVNMWKFKKLPVRFICHVKFWFQNFFPVVWTEDKNCNRTWWYNCRATCKRSLAWLYTSAIGASCVVVITLFQGNDNDVLTHFPVPCTLITSSYPINWTSRPFCWFLKTDRMALLPVDYNTASALTSWLDLSCDALSVCIH